MDALECLRNQNPMVLLAAAQAVDLRGGPDKLGKGSRRVHARVRSIAPTLDRDRPAEHAIVALAAAITAPDGIRV
jgi:histidine ammonia-lyase